MTPPTPIPLRTSYQRGQAVLLLLDDLRQRTSNEHLRDVLNSAIVLLAAPAHVRNAGESEIRQFLDAAYSRKQKRAASNVGATETGAEKRP